MKPRKNLLTRDDWDLTRQGLEGQRVQLLLQLETLEAAISLCEGEIRCFPTPKKPDTDDEGDPKDAPASAS